MKRNNGKKQTDPLTLSTFLEKFKGAIADNIHKRFKPVYTLDMDTTELDRQIDELTIRKPEMPRPLFEAQAHVTKAAKILLNDNKKRCLFVIGELGTGKTTIFNALTHIMGKEAKHNLIVCPPHLVNKWEREIRGIFPKDTHLQVFQIRTIRDFEKAKKEANLYDKACFIISRERAKLSYFWKPDYILKRKPVEQEITRTDEDGITHKEKQIIIMNLPHCPKCLSMITDKRTGTVLEEKYLQNRKLWCQHKYHEKVQAGDNSFKEVKKLCNTPLWTADKKGLRRYALADYIAKRHKNWFDTLLLDETHEFKTGGSAQGQAAGILSGVCKKTIAMTGTIFGGRSSSLFYLLYRFSPEFKKVFKYTEETEFVKKYGIQWRITKETSIQTDGRSSKRKITPSRVEEKPGISPEIILYLIDKSVFISLDDIDNTLPPYEEIPKEIKMLPEQKSRYDTMEKSFKKDLAKALARGDKRLLSLYLQTCLCYPDLPIDSNVIYPKEQDLIDTVKAEKSNGRKV
ncbi:MAG: ATP-binding protein, partial [Nitrospirota bacterium]